MYFMMKPLQLCSWRKIATLHTCIHQNKRKRKKRLEELVVMLSSPLVLRAISEEAKYIRVSYTVDE